MLGRQAGHTEFLPTFLLCMLDFIESGRNYIKFGQFFNALFLKKKFSAAGDCFLGRA